MVEFQEKVYVTKFVTSYHNLLKRILGLSQFESTSTTCTYFRVPPCEAMLHNLIYRFMVQETLLLYAEEEVDSPRRQPAHCGLLRF